MSAAALLWSAPISLSAASEGGAVHRIRQIMVTPDRSVSLELDGAAYMLFSNYFDLYPIEVSGDLSHWDSLTTLVRTNRATNAFMAVDAAAPSFARRFYRTATNHLYTAQAKPSGPYAVGRTTRMLNDSSRTNRYNIPTNSAFMLTIWYPAEPSAGVLPAAYIDRLLAAPLAEPRVGSSGDNSNRLAQFRSFAVPDAPLLRTQSTYPVVIYSHGYTFHRQENSEKLEELASHGFVAVAMDHIDCRTSVFPGGTAVRGIFSDNVTVLEVSTAVIGRLADDRFVVEELSRLNANDPLLAGSLDLNRLGAMGWSLGNSDLGEAARTDERFKALAVLEGYLQGADTLRQEGLGRPLLAMYSEVSSEPILFNKATRDAYFFQVSRTDHFAFKDLTEEYLATNSIRRGAAALRASVVSFFSRYLKNQDDHLLDDPVAVYPEIINFRTKALYITTHPQSRNSVRGANVTLTVVGTSALGPITYQWRLADADLNGSTNASLSITNAQPANNGSYTVVLTDGVSTRTSRAAILNVGDPPVITQPPQGQTVPVGETATFTVNVTGTSPFGFQWRKGSTPLTNFVQNETTSTFTLTNVRTNDAGNYRVVVTNAFNVMGVASPLVPLAVTVP